MQVKKFEAKTMRDALKMVKEELGPEAIILRVKDNTRRFGLMNQVSVEITAAVAETVLKKKRFVEHRFGERAHKLAEFPARQQKEFINKFIDQKNEEQKANATVNRQPRWSQRLRYVDILDDEHSEESSAARGQNSSVARAPLSKENLVPRASSSPLSAQERIQQAARSAWTAVQNSLDEDGGRKPLAKVDPMKALPSHPTAVEVIEDLRAEVLRLHQVIQGMQKPSSAFSAYPGAIYGLPYELSAMFEKMLKMGFSEQNVGEILRQGKEEISPDHLKKIPLVKAWVAKYLLQRLEVVEDPYQGWMHIFVGPSGEGKTSVLVKMCSQLIIGERKKVAVLTTDTTKVGAVEQLRIYTQILNAPFAIVRDVRDWQDLHHELLNYDVVLVDTPGLRLKSDEEVRLLKDLLPPAAFGARTHYVVSATSKDSEMMAMADRYRVTQFKDVIFTNLDEAVNYGGLYNFQRMFQVPLSAFATGPRIPEDFERASKERFIDLLFRLTSQRGSVEEKAVEKGVASVSR